MTNQLLKDPTTQRMPALFIGHGSPMNAIANNPYTQTLNKLAARIPKPRAILVISAHWMTNGTWVTQMANPKTIHDFSGFPKELFEIQYPALGSPEIAKFIQETILTTKIYGDLDQWGLDHGTWSVLRHIYPNADIPVLQLSLDMNRSNEEHIKLGQELIKLRDHGILIIGSGNLVHNLRKISWQPHAKPFDWAIEMDEWLKLKLSEGDYSAVLNDFHKTEAGKLSIPTLEHFLPLHYVLGAADAKDKLVFEFEEIQNGSISMRSFSLGR